MSLYLIESFDEITGIDASFLSSDLISFFKRLIVKFGLAASWIKTSFGLNFLMYLNAINEESDLSLPPLIIRTFFEYFFWFVFCYLQQE